MASSTDSEGFTKSKNILLSNVAAGKGQLGFVIQTVLLPRISESPDFLDLA